jgi:hypothetical protein
MLSSFSRNDTKLYGVDTVIAIPQWYINANLNQLLLHGKTTTGGSLKDINISLSEGNTFLVGTLSSISTIVFVEGSVSKVKFILKFASGTMDYWDIMFNPPQKKTADIKNLQFGFDVDLSHAGVPAGQILPDAVNAAAQKLRNSGLGDGAFTIQQLFMDFQNAALSQYDPDITVFPENFPASAVGAFPTYLNTYLEMLRKAGGHILGYAVKVENPGNKTDPVATFPPTQLNFVTNQYQPNNNPKKDELKPDLDCVSYLMMTGADQFPVNLPLWMGNFIEPSDGANGWMGVMALAKSRFVDDFLLPVLGPLVAAYWTLSDQDGSLDLKYAAATGALTANEQGGSWSSGTLSSHSHVTNTFSNDDVYYNISTSVALSVQPEQNKIVITRTTNFDIKYIHWYGVEGNAVSNEFQTFYSVPLVITITLLGVNDGALQVKAESNHPEINPNKNTVYGDPYGWLITGTNGDYSIWKDVSDTTDTVVNNAVPLAVMEGALPGIVDAITNALKLRPLVFPGGNQLFMANPVFNDECDLLVALQYKH